MAIFAKKTTKSVAITPINKANFSKWLKKQPKNIQNQVTSSDFSAESNSTLTLVKKDGKIDKILFGEPKDINIYTYASLARKLPYNKAGYYIEKNFSQDIANKTAIGWAMECYKFTKYLANKENKFSPLVMPEKANKKEVNAAVKAIYLVRDLINTPANDMGPAEIAAAAKKLAKGCRTKVILDKDLIRKNFPAIYEVGKGSVRKPRLVEFSWGNVKHPKVTLVGKGVAFDTGGLHLKPGNSMNLMKKDMGGAAHVLGLASMIMDNKLPIRLRVIIPTVENSVDGNCYRPYDVIKTRKGISVEVGNTDAEGRLILADGLALASEDNPDLVIDFATLTGAARVALGPDLPPIFSNNEKLAKKAQDISMKTSDPLWHMPLWDNYNSMLNSSIADTNNVASGGFAGAITAALFLQKFVNKGTDWMHIDTFGWCPSAKAGKPIGGEAYGIRAIYKLLEEKYK